MKKLLILLTLALALTGCASTEYEQYARSSEAASVARSKALADIASQGDSTAKVAAVMALALGTGTTQLQAPQPNAALQWAQILIPSLTQVAGVAANMKLGIVNSNNAVATASATSAAYVGIASKIQAPVAITPQANISNTTNTADNHSTDSHLISSTTLSGTGTLGSGAYNTSTTDTHASTSTTQAPAVITPVITVTPVITQTPTIVNPTVITPVITQTPTVITPVITQTPTVITPIANPATPAAIP
jgi:hypothetical protein